MRLCIRFVLLAACAAGAYGQTAISYTVRIANPDSHYAQVEMRVPSAGKASVELKMAVWTAYVIREYAKNVEGVEARAAHGGPLTIRKTAKNRWVVDTKGTDAAIISYRVYSHKLHVQDNWIDDEFALLSGAATFMTIVEPPSTKREHRVRVILPETWKTVISGMPERNGELIAADYDTLVDSPIVAGNPAIYDIKVDGKLTQLVNVSEGGVFDGERAARDVGKIVEAARAMWGSLPYERYAILNMLTGGGGGMEHMYSTAIMGNREASKNPQRYHAWLSLVAHEYFHLWNVKRLRPAEIVPGDFEQEPYFKTLGIAEGFTSYYSPLLLRRSGLATDEEFYRDLSRTIEQLQATPGRLVQSLAMSSFDTWIKFYGPDENSSNTAISYYTKGEVVGFLLDARIRKASKGQKTLDDAMRLALATTPNYTLHDFRRVCEKVAGTDLIDFFQRAFESTEELDYSEALAWFGLKRAPSAPAAPTGRRGVQAGPSFLGAEVRSEGGRLTVAAVRWGSAASKAGLSVGDEIIGVDDWTMTDWRTRLAAAKVGSVLDVKLSRRDRELTRKVTVEADPTRWGLLAPDPAATAEQVAHRTAWLNGK
ncbi:MAG: PDZ domain-containing protein [Bryobacteraceae bacterium]